jgi:hypothetical protein
MKRIIGFTVAACASVLLAACGGGGGGGTAAAPTTPTTPATNGFAQTYTASAAAGELMTYSIDTSALTYSFTITKSSYGCEVASAPCHSGSGTLTKNSDGTFSPSQSPTSKIFALQNGLLVGSVKMTLNGTAQIIPIVGVANPITTAAALAGTYNFMSLQCTGKTYGAFTGCGTFAGTATIASNGTYTTCTGADVSAPVHSCSNSTSGTATSLGGGVWQLQATSPATGATTNYFLAFTAPNGQNVGVIDFNDTTVYGYGQAIMSSEVATTTAGLTGNYVWSNDYGQSGVVTLNPNSTTSSGLAIAQNSPWTGISTVTGGSNGTGYGMIAGNGVYVYRNPNISAAYFEVGLKVQ